MKRVNISEEAKRFILEKLKKAGRNEVVIYFEGFA